jgi:hypothetical protein
MAGTKAQLASRQVHPDLASETFTLDRQRYGASNKVIETGPMAGNLVATAAITHKIYILMV